MVSSAKLIKTGEFRGNRSYETPCGRVEVEFCVKSHSNKQRDRFGRRIGGTYKTTWYQIRVKGEAWSRPGTWHSLPEVTAAAFELAATLD